MHYNYFRDYDPSSGRYIESDLIGLSGGINTYSYVGSNALVRFDSLGLQALSPTTTMVPQSCPCKDILKKAKELNNDPKYAYDSPYGFGVEKNKCNLFIFDAQNGQGPRRWGGLGGPTTAGEWGNSDKNLPNWTVVSDPKPGDVVGMAHNYGDATGHVAIVDVPGVSTIGVGRNGTHSTGWPWGNELPHGTPVFRRCSCAN